MLELHKQPCIHNGYYFGFNFLLFMTFYGGLENCEDKNSPNKFTQ